MSRTLHKVQRHEGKIPGQSMQSVRGQWEQQGDERVQNVY